MKKKKEGNPKKTIVILTICLGIVIIGTAAYFIYEHSIKRGFRGGNFPDRAEGERNFQPPNETIQQEITSFFESSPSASEIEDYCGTNGMYCMYYCRNMNPNSKICSQIMNRSSGGQPPQ
jgi:hypothetical protein